MFRKKEVDKKSSALERENNNENSKKKKKKKKNKEQRKIKRTTIDTLPYIKMCSNDITMVEKNVYSKTFEFIDINYTIMKQEEQEKIFIAYGKILNYFSPNIHVQISIINSKLDLNEFNDKVLYKFDDNNKLNIYRSEYNEMIQNLVDKDNKIIKNKYITLTVENNNFEQVSNEFKNLELALRSNFLNIGSRLSVVTNNQKANLLKKIFRGINTKIPEFDENDFKKQYDKNFISPDYFVFRPKYFMFDDTFGQTLILRNLPSYLSDNFILQLADVKATLNISININPVLPAAATKIIRRRLAALESDQIRYVKKASRENLPVDILPRDLKHSIEEGNELWENLSKHNEKMFLTNVVITIFSDDQEELKQLVKQVKSIASQNVCAFGDLILRQEEGFATSLPLGNNRLKEAKLRRTLTTNSTAVFMPFANQSLNSDEEGIFYGTQPNTNDVIYANRKNLINANGFILGTSGSGKSVSAKDEISQIFWKYPNDDIIIIDPEGEYTKLVEEYGGDAIKISTNTTNYINPLDISKEELKSHNPFAKKIDFMISLIEVCCGSITSIERSLVDRSLTYLYKMAIKQNKIPTLKHFQQVLLKEGEIARELAIKLEIYTTGSHDIFSYTTNIDINNRLFAYNIKELNEALKPLGMLVMLNNILTRIMDNRQNNKYTWLFIDEAHVLLKYKQAANFLFNTFKTARKWQCIPTGITQNIEDLLKSEYGRAMLNNAEYIRLLRQKNTDKDQIAELLNISDNQIQYVDNSERGSGLIIWDKIIIPFYTNIPENSKLLKLWGTSATVNM